MRYALSLHMGYDYEAPVANARHVLRVEPLSIPGRQHLTDSHVTVAPFPEENRRFTGFFGEAARSVTLRDPHDRLDIRMTATVEVETPAFQPDRSLARGDLPAALAGRRALGPVEPHHFTGASTRIRHDRAITGWIDDLAGRDSSVAAIAAATMARIHGEFRYDPRATDAQTPVSDAFRLKRGVCQDFAQVMITALRGHGIPAGYVSGYLRTLPPPGQQRLAGADAMHAWVKVWCGPDAGFIEFDPTNNCLAGTDHIVVAYGRDYSDVSPVIGVLKSFGSHTASQAVDVVPAIG